MAQPPTWRRRLAAFGVLVLAAGALIATSPPPPPRSSLEAFYRGSPRLTATNPRVTGLVTLELSASALPAPTDASRLRLSGTVEFAAGTRPGIRMQVRPVGLATSPSGVADPSSDGDVEHAWPIEQLCRVAEPCRREFEVTVELVAPQPGEVVTAGFEAKVEIVYREIDAIPLGATATWSASPEFAPAAAPTPP